MDSSSKMDEKINKLEVELLLMKKEMEMVKLTSEAESNEIGRNLCDKIFTMNTFISSSINGIGQLKQLILDMGRENDELRENNCGLKNEIGKIKDEILEKDQKVDALNKIFDKFKKQNDEKNAEIGKMAKEMAEINAELVKAVKLLGQKADNNHAKCIVIKNNKLNGKDCGTRLTIYRNGLVLKCSDFLGWLTVSAIHPVLEFLSPATNQTIYYYFEMKILYMKDELLLPYCGHFESMDVVGVGIGAIKSSGKENDLSLKCFASCNGKLLDILELTESFGNVYPLYPAVALKGKGSAIRVNFGQDDWAYDPLKLIQ